MKIAVTGHRPSKLGYEYNLNGPFSTFIRDKLREIIVSHKPKTMISGMALGVDTIWAELAIENQVPLIAAIPFIGQESHWPEDAQNKYNKILNHELTTIQVICGPGYSAYKMQKRNEWMVDQCDLLVAVWNGTAGGTKNCVDYAEGKKPMIVIKPIIEEVVR